MAEIYDLKKMNLKNVSLLLLGTFLMAVAINVVFEPLGMVSGGVTGLAIIIKCWSAVLFENLGFEGYFAEGIPVWITNLAINVPLFLLALKNKGKKYILRTATATVLLSAWLAVLPIGAVFNDMFQSMLFGGVLSGIGIGMVFLSGSTTGGTDLLCDLIHLKIRSISLPMLLLVVDGIIVVAGVLTFGLDVAVYAICVVYLVSKISDGLLSGMKFAKTTYIISDEYEEIAKQIMSKLDRGATLLSGTGMYSGKKRDVLYCAVSNKQLPDLLDIVHEVDRNAFIIISDAREIRGEGFIEYKQRDDF